MADPPHLLPLSTCLLLLPNAPEVVIGRRQGRPLHAVRLQGDLFLDLYEALRLLPVIGIELDGRGISAPVELFASPDALPPGELAVIAPWLMSDHGKRVIATDPGRRTFEVEICGRLLKATVWMPAITEGIQNDTLAWAGQIQLDEHRCTGATPTSLLDRLELSPTEPVGWTRTELLELAAILQQIESQNVDVSPFVLEVFADRAIPLPNLDDEREYLLTAALLNWVGAAHRKAGRPRAALAALDAAARATSPTDDDSRADILHNQGLAHLDLRDQEEGALDRAVEAFQRSAQLHPTDDAPWIQLALIALLRDDLPAAEEAWMQAATRATNPDHYSVFMANAGAAAQG